HKFIAKPHVHRQLGTRLPLIMNVYVKFPFTKVTIGVRLTRLGPLEEERGALQEGDQATKRIEAAPPSLLLEVALDAVYGSAKSEIVRFVRPDEVVRQWEFVLHFQKRCEDARPDRRQTGDVHATVLLALRKEVQRGSLIRSGLHVRFTGSCEAEAQ